MPEVLRAPEDIPASIRKQAEALVKAINGQQEYRAPLRVLNALIAKYSESQARSLQQALQKNITAKDRLVDMLPRWTEGQPTPQGFQLEINTPEGRRWREVVGVRIPFNERWDAKSINARGNYFVKRFKASKLPGQRFTLQDIYGWEPLVDSQQAARITTQHQDSETMPARERDLLLEAHLQVTYRELFANTLEQYYRMYQRYRELRADCVRRGVPEKEANVMHKEVEDHYQRVLKTAEERRNYGLKLMRTWRPGQRYTQAQLAPLFEIDTRLWNLLKAESQTAKTLEPGEKQLPPAHVATIRLLNYRYQHMLRQVDGTDVGNPDALTPAAVKEIRGRIATAHTEIFQELQKRRKAGDIVGISEAEINRWIKDPRRLPSMPRHAQQIFNGVARSQLGATRYKQYQADINMLRTSDRVTASTFLQAGMRHVGSTTELHQELLEYQFNRARLASVRHHFQQVYGFDAKGAPLQGTDTAQQMKVRREALQKFAIENREDAYNSMINHLNYVENHMLQGGIMVNLEHFHNHHVRFYFAWMADKITDLQTMWLPRVGRTEPWPGPLKYVQDLVNTPRSEAKRALMGAIPDLLGWPRYTQKEVEEIIAKAKKDGQKVDHTLVRAGEPKQWAHMSKADMDRMRKRQQSISDILQDFHDSETVQNFRSSIETARAVARALPPEDLLTFQPETPETLTAARKVIGNRDLGDAKQRKEAIAALRAANPGWSERKALRVLFNIVLDDVSEKLEAYAKQYEQAMKAFHRNVDMHTKWSDEALDFARRGFDFCWGALVTALGIAAYLYLRRKFRRGRGGQGVRNPRTPRNPGGNSTRPTTQRPGNPNAQNTNPPGQPPETTGTTEARQRRATLVSDVHSAHGQRFSSWRVGAHTYAFTPEGSVRVTGSGLNFTIDARGVITPATGTATPSASVVGQVTGVLETLHGTNGANLRAPALVLETLRYPGGGAFSVVEARPAVTPSATKQKANKAAVRPLGGGFQGLRPQRMAKLIKIVNRLERLNPEEIKRMNFTAEEFKLYNQIEKNLGHHMLTPAEVKRTGKPFAERSKGVRFVLQEVRGLIRR